MALEVVTGLGRIWIDVASADRHRIADRRGGRVMALAAEDRTWATARRRRDPPGRLCLLCADRDLHPHQHRGVGLVLVPETLIARPGDDIPTSDAPRCPCRRSRARHVAAGVGPARAGAAAAGAADSIHR